MDGNHCPPAPTLGLTIAGGWAIDETNEFIWTLGCDAAGSFAAAVAAYYASEERAAFEPDRARFIVSTYDRMGRRVV